MQDTFNIIGIFSFLFSLVLLFYILKKKNGPLILCGWFGLFVYSTPSFINRARKLIYTSNEEYYLVVPDIESKLIYFLFWLGFGLALLLKNFNFKQRIYSKSINYNSLNIFTYLSFFYLLIYLLYIFSGYDVNRYIGLIGKWLFLFTLICFSIKKKIFFIIFVLLITIIYSLLIFDRTVVIMMLSFAFASFIIKNFYKTKNFKEFLRFYLISFIAVIVTIASIIFTKYFSVSIVHGNALSIDSMLKVVAKLNKSYEPFIIYGHTMFAIDQFKDFSTIKYLIAILSNITLYPSVFDLSSNYYNNSLMKYLPHYSFGVAGSIMASTYLAFGYTGLFITGYIYGLLLKTGDFALRFKYNTSTVLLSTICLIMSIYIHRNGLDNFLSLVRQVFLLFIFIKLQELFIRFVLKK